MKFNIFGKTASVSIEPMQDDLCGLFYYDTYEIKINESHPNKLGTFYHELFHAAFHRAGLNQAGISKEIQEVIVENFSVVMAENIDSLIKFSKELKKMDKKR